MDNILTEAEAEFEWLFSSKNHTPRGNYGMPSRTPLTERDIVLLEAQDKKTEGRIRNLLKSFRNEDLIKFINNEKIIV